MAATTIAGIASELTLDIDGFLKAIQQAGSAGQKFERQIQGEIDKITGAKASQQVLLIEKALERVGGVSKLTAQQVENLRGRIEALARSGAKLPSSLTALTKGGNLGQLGANLQTQGLSQLQGQLGPVGGLLTGISGSALLATAGIAGLAVGAGAAAKAFTDAAVEFGEFAGHLTDLSAQTGIGTTALQELAFVGSFVGTSLDEVASAVARMQKGIAEGDSVFQRLGLSLAEIQDLAPEEQFFKVAESINAIQDPAQRTAAAIEVFGRSGASLLPLFGNLERLREEAHRLGVVFDEDAVRSGDKLDDAFNRLGRSADALKLSIGALAANTGFIKFLETLAAGIGAVSANLPAFIAGLNQLGPILSALPGGGAISNVAQLAGLAGSLGGAGAATADPAAAAALAKRTIAGTQFETAAEEAKRKKIEAERQRDAEQSAKAAEAAAEKAAKAWADSAEKARVEWDKFFKSMDEAGDEALSDMFKQTMSDAKASADAGAAAFAAQIAAVAELGESFGEADAKAQELLSTFGLLKTLGGGDLTNQTTAGLQQMGEEIAELDQSIPGVADALAEVNAEIAKRGGKPIISAEELKRIAEAARKLQELADGLGAISGALGDLGESIGGVGGALAGLGSAAAGTLSNLKNAAVQTASVWQKTAGAIGAASNIISSSRDEKSAGKRALGGAAKGAMAGAAFGPWGAVIGAVAGGLIGLFSGPKWKSTAETASKIFGDELGKGVSDELAKAIFETQKQLGVGAETASLLHIGDVMDEAGGSATEFADEMQTLLQGIESGTVPAEEGIAALGDAFSRLADEAATGAVSAQAQMGALAAEARALGQSIPEIDAAVKQAVSESTGALGGLAGIKLVDEADARSQAQIFLNVFNSVLATEGIVAAAKAIKPALDTFKDSLKEAGIGNEAVASILGPIQAGMSLLKNDLTKGAAEGATALKTILESQLSAGFLDTNTFQAIQQQAGTVFDQLIKGGADTGAAFQAIGPLLAQIQQTAQATGQTLDPVTQGLIDQASAAGFAFPTEPIERVVTLLESIAVALGATIPAAATTSASAISMDMAAAAGSASSSMQTLSSSASTSLSTVVTAAGQTSASVVAAFDGVGAQITSAILPAGDAIQQQLASVFDQATAEAQQFASLLSKLDSTTLTIPFKFEGTGELPGGGFTGDLMQFDTGSGGIMDFGKETIAALHGREAVIPENDLQNLLRSTAALGASSGRGGSASGTQIIQLVLDGRVLADINSRLEKRNTRGGQTRGKRGYR